MPVRFLQRLFPGLDNKLAPLIIEKDAFGAGDEVAALELPAGDQTEDQPVDENRLEDLGDIEVERMTPEVRLVEIADARVKMRLVDLGQNSGVEERITKRDKCIGLVARRASRAWSEGKFGLDDAWPGRVVGFACLPFEGHKRGRR